MKYNIKFELSKVKFQQSATFLEMTTNAQLGFEKPIT